MKGLKSFVMCTLTLVFVSFGSQAATAGEFALSSPQLQAGSEMAMEQVFNGFGCTGRNISPELHWSWVPAGTKSLALTVYDPDAPMGSGWWHWVIFNIDPPSPPMPVM